MGTMRMKDGLAYNLNNAPSTESTKKTQHKKYLTQPKLEKLLKEIQDFEWLGSEIKVPGYPKRKWDMKFKYNSNIFIVEYDGDEHYRNSLKIKVDHEKDKTARDLGLYCGKNSILDSDGFRNVNTLFWNK